MKGPSLRRRWMAKLHHGPGSRRCSRPTCRGRGIGLGLRGERRRAYPSSKRCLPQTRQISSNMAEGRHGGMRTKTQSLYSEVIRNGILFFKSLGNAHLVQFRPIPVTLPFSVFCHAPQYIQITPRVTGEPGPRPLSITCRSCRLAHPI
jgi:hypothetical protein